MSYSSKVQGKGRENNQDGPLQKLDESFDAEDIADCLSSVDADQISIEQDEAEVEPVEERKEGQKALSEEKSEPQCHEAEEVVAQQAAVVEKEPEVDREAGQQEQEEVVEEQEECEPEDEAFEMLDMLCDAADVDDYKETKDKELKMMNTIMDQRQKQRDQKEQTRKMQKTAKEVDNCVEENSGIILKDKTRQVSKDELVQKVTHRRKFVSLEKIDSAEMTSSTGLVGGAGKGFFTVGVIVDRIGVLNSKAGKKFSILKLSNLVKYNVVKVKEHLARVLKNDEDGQKIALRAFNADAYKTVSFMAFGESALPAKNINSGTVVAIMNPKILPQSSSRDKTEKQGVSFCIDSIDAIVQIGFSKDFNICVRESQHPVSQKMQQCYRFVNTSVERICESHRQELQAKQLQSFKSARVSGHSTLVDINEITRRQQASVEANISAFGTRHFKRDNRPKQDKSAQEMAFLKKQKAKQNANLDNFYNRRAKQTANINVPLKITAFQSTETRILLGDHAFDEVPGSRKKALLANNNPQNNNDSEDSGLEFEDVPMLGDGKGIGQKATFKDFLAQKKISYSERFGAEAAASISTGAATNLSKRRKTVQN